MPGPTDTSADALAALVERGDVAGVREYFDAIFWHNRTERPSWRHLKIALRKEDRPMLRLLSAWGATPSDDDWAGLRASAKEKYPAYVRLLGAAGLRPANPEMLEIPAAPVPASPPPPPAIGALTSDGIYVGLWEPSGADGSRLGKIFEIYAAPQDLDDGGGRTTMNYDAALRRLSSLKSWNGFDGGNYRNDKNLREALRGGTYHGEWVIPPREIANGADRDGNAVQPDNLMAHRDAGALRGSFNAAAHCRPSYPSLYWSSTESPPYAGSFWLVGLATGDYGWNPPDTSNGMSCRLVRFVEVPR